MINHAPKRFVIENGKLTGMEFERLEWDAKAKNSKIIDTIFLPVRRCDPRHRPGQRVPLD